MEEQGGPGGLGPPTFLAGGAWPPHFSVENKGIIKKKLINAVVGFGPSDRSMATPPPSNYIRPSMASSGNKIL